MVDEVIDKMNFFEKLPANEVLIKKGEPLDIAVENKREFEGFKASMLSVLKEHDRLDEKAVGVHFDDRLHFLYYNQKEVIDIVPPREFEADNLFENIANLRDGSDRLVEKFKKKHPSLYTKIDNIKGEKNIFDITAMILELEDESFEGISSSALEFMGKGGLQIDTKVEDNRFNDYAFLASIISYKLTDAQNSLLCYSIYESFGDYIADIVNQLLNKTKASTLTLSGKSFANQSLWGRIQRNLALKKPILNINYPIGEENQVYGAGFL
jgi:hydrogenase maturation factor HypF (carbamoyltransferase family)